MYTRNYRQIREDSKQRADNLSGAGMANPSAERKTDGENEDNFDGNDVGIVWEAKNEKEIPPGYRGTTMLRDPEESSVQQMNERENEYGREREDKRENKRSASSDDGAGAAGEIPVSAKTVSGRDAADEAASDMRRIPRQPMRRVRVRAPRPHPEPETPPGYDGGDGYDYQGESCRMYPRRGEPYGTDCGCGEPAQQRHDADKTHRSMDRERDGRGDDRCECTVRKRPGFFGHEFSTDDLLLGGLIILLLNEGADDIIIIILALLLISGFGGDGKREDCD